MGSRLDLTEMERGLPVPTRQNGIEDCILHLKKNPLQFLLQMFRNAVHGKSSMIQSDFLSYDELPS
jgi:hypothetical protein